LKWFIAQFLKLFGFFFPPHHKIEARYVLMFSILLLSGAMNLMMWSYIWFGVWRHPIPFAKHAENTTIPLPDHLVVDNERILESLGPPVQKPAHRGR